MNFLKTKITTPRLFLKPISMDYAKVIFKEFTPEITRYMFPDSPKKIEETQKFISETIAKREKGEELVLVILDRETEEFLGCVGGHDLNTKTPIMGIWLKKSAHGNKYGQEAALGLKKWIDKNIKYDFIIWDVDKANIASQKVAKSLGGNISKEIRKVTDSGKILDEVEYRIPSPPDRSGVIITTKRLKLIPKTRKYAREAMEEFSKISTFMAGTPTTSIKKIYENIKNSLEMMKKGIEMELHIIDKKTKEFIGSAGLYEINTSKPELGLWIKKSKHRQGFGKEILNALIQWTNKNLKFEYLVYPVDKANIPSRKLAESLGGKVGRKFVKKTQDGKILNEVEYWIKKSP